MDSIAIRLRDPSGEHWAQLVDPSLTVGRILPVFVERLGLPRDLNYELLREAENAPLPPAATLANAGINPGATLVIRPVRDSFLTRFLKELYDEAVSNVRDELWDRARERLETIYRLDPQYPDTQQLWKQVGAAATGKATAGHGRKAAASAATAGGTTVAGAGRRVLGQLFLLLVVAVVGGGALIYFEVVDRPDWMPDWFPSRETAQNDTTLINGVEVGTGDVRVTLTWNNAADIDLHVTDPRGEEIYFGNPTSATGGRLDVDANGGCGNDPAVENVFWPTGQAPTGTYGITVHRFSACGAGPTRYEVTVFVGGILVDTQTGILDENAPTAVLPTFRR